MRASPRTGVIAFISSADDRAELAEALPKVEQLMFCPGIERFIDSLKHLDAGMAVVDFASTSSADMLRAVAAANARRPAIPLVLRISLRRAEVVEALSVAALIDTPCISIRGVDSLGKITAPFGQMSSDFFVRYAIIARVAARTPQAVHCIVLGAAALGARHANVSELARMCCLSVRAMEARLAAAMLIPAKRLLMWSITLHSIWRAQQLDWPPKRIANEGGFRNSEALSKLVHRTTGLRFAACARNASFAQLVDVFAQEVLRAVPRPH